MDPVSILLGLGVPQKFAKVVAYAILAVVVVLVLAVAKCSYDRHVIAGAQQKVEAKAKPATDQAATERANDTIAQAKEEQETHNAIAAQPDQPIAPSSHALACEQLRRAGRHPASCR